MIITDEYISELFKCGRFGGMLDTCPIKQREYLKKSLKNQVDGYWSGSTMYHIMVFGGFIVDGKSGTHKKLTAIGQILMES